MGVDVTRDKGRATVKFSGECTVEQAAEIHSAILGAFDGANTITFEIAEMERADLTLLQILCSSHLEAKERSVAFEITSSSSVLADTVKEAGFQRTIPCPLDPGGTCVFRAGGHEGEKS